MKRHKKAFGVYHWDTFDNDTWLVGEVDNQAQAEALVQERYRGRLSGNGADRVDIVDKHGNVVKKYRVK